MPKANQETISRTRFVIRRDDSKEFLKTLEDGVPTWTANPLEAMTHCHEDVAMRNIEALHELCALPTAVSCRTVTYTALAAKPSQWFVDEASL